MFTRTDEHREIPQVVITELQLSDALNRPQREVANRLARDSYPQIDDQDRVYFRDVYDHLVRLHDISESLRDLVGGAIDTYLSVVSNRTNDIMKALTIVTVLFMPLTFLVGFFGMNFFGGNIELSGTLPGRILFWGNNLLMLITPFGIWYWAWRHGWFSNGNHPED